MLSNVQFRLYIVHTYHRLRICIRIIILCINVSTYLFINILSTFLSFVIIIRLKIRRNFHLFSTVCVWIKVLLCLKNTIFFRPAGRSENLVVICPADIFRRFLFSLLSENWIENSTQECGCVEKMSNFYNLCPVAIQDFLKGKLPESFAKSGGAIVPSIPTSLHFHTTSHSFITFYIIFSS